MEQRAENTMYSVCIRYVKESVTVSSHKWKGYCGVRHVTDRPQGPTTIITKGFEWSAYHISPERKAF